MTAPCKNCKNRAIGCHGKCAKYAAWKKKHEQERTRLAKELEALDAVIREQKRMKKTRRKK